MDDETDLPKFGREGLIWVSCGPNQIHFPRDVKAQALTAGHIGLRYRSLDGLTKRLIRASSTNMKKCFESYEICMSADNDETIIKIKDRYGTVFHCREGTEKSTQKYKQSVVKLSDEDKFGDVALRYGVKDDESTDCRGIDYVEFDCPMTTAEKIAQFYESIFDATTFVVREDESHNKAAYIVLGDLDVTTTRGRPRASQYLIFRETPGEIPAYDGYHIAVYMGETPHDTQDFERAFHKAQRAGLLSSNWRDAADVFSLEGARSQKQFRIEHILDMDNPGRPPIFQLEHEIRSVEHPTWPGRGQRK